MLRKAGSSAAAFSLGALFLLALALSPIASAQEGHFDASVNAAAVFTMQSDGNGVSQSATNGANFFGTFRVKLRARHSLLFNYGRAKDSQVYQTGFDFHILNTISEYSGAYMFSPFQKGRFQPFVLAGAGALTFSPRSTWIVLPDINGLPNRVQLDLGAAKQTKPAFLYGAGLDYQLPVVHHLAVRLQYRGFIYNAPDFAIDATSGSSVSLFTGAKGHMAEPSVGLVYQF